MKRLLTVFSHLFHPLFIPAYATLFYFVITKDFFYQHEIYLVFIQVLILTMLLPMSVFYLLRSLSLVKTKMLVDKKERKLPLAFYAVLLFILIKHSFSVLVLPELYYYFVGVLVSVVLALALLLFGRKASLHMIAISSLTLFIIGISAYYHVTFLYLIAFCIICSGFVASSRLRDNGDGMGSVILGTAIGILPQVGLWYFWLVPTL
ncbi:hypothetical protein HYN59_02710 [Flavobacterium album]|uniref:Uncharacterized protein n=1 Tax=Flavobacterium album TaxID=2175091 RepID=A0A2S1QUN6_9FLAO|nr:hypothetical protein [Flavobacterium album]AWH84086.1 hypothetical protein HYN59_02710 [Flavobacterium album]